MFITFEGIDGSGKSTQVKKFTEYLFAQSKYNHLVLTREPYQSTDVRKILYEQDALSKAEKLAELFIADRKKHADELIIPSINKNLHVISDRYKLSTIAYQSAQGLDIHELIRLHAGLPIPDITFIIDVPAKHAASRMSNEAGRKAHTFEADTAFLEKVRQQFLVATRLLTRENIHIIDGSQTPEHVFAQIEQHMNALIERKAST